MIPNLKVSVMKTKLENPKFCLCVDQSKIKEEILVKNESVGYSIIINQCC